MIKSFPQTGPGHDQNDPIAVIREAHIHNPLADSVHEDGGLNTGNKSSKDEEFKGFWKVQEAEAYLDLIMSIYPEDAVPFRTNEDRLLRGWICVYTPIFKTQSNPETKPYKQCLYTFIQSQVWKKEFSLGLQRCFIRYFNALGKHPSWQMPRFYDQMKRLNKRLKPPHQHDLWMRLMCECFRCLSRLHR